MGFAALLATTALTSTGAINVAPANAAPGDPFPVDEPAVFIAQGQPNTTLYRANIDGLSGEWVFEAEGTGDVEYNGIGWNRHDGYVYGFVTVANSTYARDSLVRIGEDGVVTPVIPADHNFIAWAGDFDDNGRLYAFNSAGTQFAWYDIANGTSGKGTITNNSAPLSVSLWDVVYSDGFFWSASGGAITRIDPVAGSLQVFTVDFIPAGTYGAAWKFGNGNLGFGANSGTMYQIAVDNPGSTSPTFNLISSQETPAHSRNDGTSIPGLPADLEIEKTGDATFTHGGEFEYVITVRNNGDGVSSGWTMTDQIPAGLTLVNVAAPGQWYQDGDTLIATGGRMAPGDEREIRLTVRADDVQTECLENTANILGNESDPNNDNNADTTETCLIQAHVPSIELTKSTDLLDYNVGDVITYEFAAENTGNVPLTGVTITDPMVGLTPLTNFVWPGAPNELQPGEIVTANATLVVTQAHIDAASIANTASVVGTPPVGENVTDTSTVTVPFTTTPDIELLKTTDLNEPYVVGDTITYDFVATNTGNVTLHNVSISDPLPGLTSLVYDWTGATVEGTLAPGESVSATATLLVTQAHVNAGGIDNTATAVGTDPSDTVVDDQSTVVVPLDADPSIELIKSTDLTGTYGLGDTITYTFIAENTGNVTLTDVEISDPMPGLSDLTYDWSDAAGEGTLNPGQTVSATATLTVTQAHLDQRWITNTATVDGTPPTGPNVTDSSTVTVIPEFDPSIELTKTGVLDGQATAGETVTYEFEAVNTGNVTLTGVTITDLLPGLSTLIFDWTDATAEGILAPGERLTATASYVLTLDDVNANSVINTATATGTPPAVTDPEDPDAPAVPSDPVTDEDPETVVLPQEPALQLVKSGALTPTGEPSAVGDTVEFEFVATNIGNVTLTDVIITDPLPGLSELVFDWSAAAGEGTLEPGEQVTATATYVLTQADIDAGHVANTGSVTGTPPTIDPENPPAPLPPVEDDVIVPVPPAPSIELIKSSELLGGVAVGETVEFTFVAENTGNTTLTDVEITDPLPGLSDLAYDWSGATAEGTLLPGEQVSATATYVLTQEDVDTGFVVNTATVEGTPPDVFDPENPDEPGVPSDPITDDSTVITHLPPAPSIELVKTSELRGDVAVGETVEFHFVATNTGNTTLTGVTITDPLEGLSELVFDWSGATTAGTLLPGEHVSATATYVLTQADVDTGFVVNTATTTGTPPDVVDPENPDEPGEPSDPITDDSIVITELPANPRLDVVKTSAVTGKGEVGDRLNYTIVVTNTGNVTLSDITIEDPLPGLSLLTYDWSNASVRGSLAAGESVTATAIYILTEADVRAGKVVNTATAGGTPPAVTDPLDPDAPAIPGMRVTGEDTVTTTTGALAVTGDPSIWISLTAGGILIAAGIVLMIRNRRQLAA